MSFLLLRAAEGQRGEWLAEEWEKKETGGEKSHADLYSKDCGIVLPVGTFATFKRKKRKTGNVKLAGTRGPRCRETQGNGLEEAYS